VLRDCIEHPELVRRLYKLAVDGIESKKKTRFFWFNDSPDQVLQKSLGILDLLVAVLKDLRALADEHVGVVVSDGFNRLFATMQAELDDEYLQVLDRQLRDLRFRRGTLLSARIGRANRGTGYVLRRTPARGLLDRITGGGRASYSFVVPDRDEHGMQSLADLRGRGINQGANAVAQSADHILAFFALLRAEVAFYVGCLNLHETLVERGVAICLPEPRSTRERAFSARALVDASLVFHLGGRVVGNDIDGDDASLVLVTGANQGGKSTFLRSVGLAQLMMQAGMFVAADSFRASVSSGVFTHFKREEDATMTHGKLDEELARMSDIAESITPGSLLLCNESFASTNEREGSEIAHQVVRALAEAAVRVFFVTHLYDLADTLHRDPPAQTLFLRAERTPDGGRTFRIVPGEPLPTSYGEDSYRRIFGASARVARHS
jgi:DNA mismatch repair ATPase MutS